MGRLPINNDLTRGPWTKEEDEKLIDYVHKNGLGSWQLLPKKAGLNRCGKSCRLRWTNYLRPDIKRGNFSLEEEQTIINLHSILGNKWATIATRLPGRTDNEIKNYWNTQLKKRLIRSGIDPNTHQPLINQDYNHLNLLLNIPPMFPNPDFNNQMMRNPLENLAKIQILSNILQVLNVNPVPNLLNGSSQFLNHFDGQLHGLSGNVQMTPMVTNMEQFNQLSTDSQPHMSNSEVILRSESRDSDNKKGILGSSSNANSDYTLPALVPAAQEISSVGQEEAMLRTTADIPNYNELMGICNDSVTGWGTVMDDEASSSFWKDIFD